MTDQVYDPRRMARLVLLLRAIAERIRQYPSDGELLAAGPDLLKMMGDARSELFHYEVRQTYDTPEVAQSRRVVREAQRQAESMFDGDEREGDEPWQRP